MKELIERLEKATGSDREIDGAIALALGWTLQKMKGDARPYYRRPGVTDYYMRSEAPNYTGSFDDARTLVPGGFYWLVSEGRTRENEPLGGAQVFRPNYLVEPISEGEHESAIIALCIAALEARASTQAEAKS